MTARRRPPIIQEIAKAYQNDPRTLLAQTALKAGTSTAPVAEGKYAWADGLARALQGMAGAYIDNKQRDVYGDLTDKTIADRRSLGQDPLTGAVAPAAQMAPTAPQAAPASAPAVATALGAAPPAQTAPSAPVAPPVAAPTAGAGPVSRRPFGPTSAASTRLAPGEVSVPNAPDPVDMQKVASDIAAAAPQAVGPTRSKLLDAAYKILSSGSEVDSDRGMDMYSQGLSDQTKLNEAAAERTQRLRDMGFETAAHVYGEGLSQDRSNAYEERRGAIGNNYGNTQRRLGEQFQHGENAANRANAIAVAKIRESNSGGGVGSWGLTPEEEDALSKAAADGRVDVTRLNSRTAKIQARIFMAVPGFNGVTNHGNAALIGNATAQQKAMLAGMLPEVLDNVRSSGKKLKFSDVQFAGKAQLWAKGQLNDPDLREYMTQRADAVQTLAQVMRGVGATDKAVALETDAAPKFMSPRAWDAWYQGNLKNLRPRIAAYEKRGLLAPGTTDEIDRLGGATPTAAASGGWGKATVVGR